MTAAAGTLVEQFAHAQGGQDLLVTVVDDKVHAQRFVVAREVSTGRERRFGVAPEATADDVRSLLPAHATTIPSEEDVASRARARKLVTVAVSRWGRASRAGTFDRWRRTVRADALEEELRNGRIRARCVTWNQQAKEILDVDALRSQLLEPDRFHLIHVGCQECERSILNSVANPSKREWTATLQSCLGPAYSVVASHALQATHGVVFGHESVLGYINNVATSAVATGLGVEGAKMGNKGGIGIALKIGGLDVCFVAAPLCAHQHKVKERNAEYHAISSGLAKSLAPGFLDDSIEGGDRMRQAFDAVVWSGDLNYRVDLSREDADAALASNDLHLLKARDQLDAAMKNGDAFAGYVEAERDFLPTYKFDKRSDVYDTSEKRRDPSWTDRVLVASKECAAILAYESVSDLRWSDHRPVAATVALAVDPAARSPAGFSRKAAPEKSEVCSLM
jgi:hypothetical protein